MNKRLSFKQSIYLKYSINVLSILVKIHQTVNSAYISEISSDMPPKVHTMINALRQRKQYLFIKIW
jgi:hypothetical protein